MFGIDIIMHCPVCKKNRRREIGRVETIKYKGEMYSLIHCHWCDNLIAAQVVSAESCGELADKVEDKTGKRFVKRLEAYFTHKDYSDSTPEEKIESEMFEHAKEILGEELAMAHEYEVKYAIQWLMTHTFNVPENKNLKSHVYEDIKDETVSVSVTCF